MDIDLLMTQDGMREYTDGQRETWVTDVVQVETLAQVLQARLAQTAVKGDKPRSAKRRARKVAKRFRKASRLVRDAAAEIEAANAVFVREVVELPTRRAEALESRQERSDRRAVVRGMATTQVAMALGESAHGFNTDAQVVPPVPQHAPLLHPQPFPMPQGLGSELGPITDYFPRIDLPEAL